MRLLWSVQPGRAFGAAIGAAEQAILGEWRFASASGLPPELGTPKWPVWAPGSAIRGALSTWATACPRPLVLFIDEIDALEGEALRSILSQLRSGHPERPQGFPWSLALVGMRAVWDYKLAAGGSPQTSSHSTSTFNIIAESITLRNFTRKEVGELYAQHTADTGQTFARGVSGRVYDLTRGQPWLVNALARQRVEKLVPDPTKTADLPHVDQAKALLIQRRDTHIDALAERLKEPRVRRIIEPNITGDLLLRLPDNDSRFVIDLGLMRRKSGGGLEIANPIYAELIPRVLTDEYQDSLGAVRPSWRSRDGQLDPDALLEAFLTFWRRHAEPLMKGAPYHEAAPHIVMMAFLQTVVNGGGRLEREYAAGSGRLDLYLEVKDTKMAIELKMWRPNESDPLDEGLEQIDEYLASLSLDKGWLVIFDRRSNRPRLAQRTSSEAAQTPKGREVIVIRA